MENSFERQVNREVLIGDAHKKAKALIERDEIKISDFKDIYGEPRVEKDLAHVQKLEAKMEKDATAETRQLKQLAEVLEAIIHEQGELANWFGEKAHTIKTAKYDDMVNGVDEVVAFREDRSLSFLALGVDVTYSKDLEKKLERIKREIVRGELGTVQYFEDEESNTRRELKRIPRVVIGVDSERVLELAEMWLAGKSSLLAQHDVQFQILEEIEKQCAVFYDFAKRHGKDAVAEKYAHTGDVIAEIQMEKMGKIRDSGKRDEVFNELIDGLDRFK